MMNDEVHGELLDAEFRQILYIIKPLINNINDHYHLERYRVWLERLSSVYPSEKLERNKYLLELANQIHDNELKSPFTLNPPKGLLPAFGTLQKKKSEVEWPYISPRPAGNTQSNTIRRCPSVKESTSSEKKSAKVKAVRPFEALGKTDNQITSESTSWCDLTDAGSTTQVGDTDVDEDKSSLSQQHKNEGLKVKEHFTKKYSQGSIPKSNDESSPEKKESTKKMDETKDSKVNIKPSLYFDVEEEPETKNKSRKPTAQEVEALKMRMKDLLQVKNALRDTHCLTENRKKTIENLQEQLIEMQRENGELKLRLEGYEKKRRVQLTRVEQENLELQGLLETQQKKFFEMEEAKAKELSSYKEKFTLLRQKELEFLKQYHKNEVDSLEQQHTARVLELETKIKSLEKEYDGKIKQLTESNLSLLKQKDYQIEKLGSELKLRASQPSAEGAGEQVLDLKRCISHLEKMLHKNNKEYAKKIDKLKQELEMKEMTTQVQLQTQRADLIVRNTAVKQEELLSALNNLENKYKKMVEDAQMQALQAKKHDEQVIEDLRNLLNKNNISYENEVRSCRTVVDAK